MRPMRKTETGFSLIEVLAALVVFSVSIIGLTHAGTQSTQTVAVLQDRTLAAIVADNQMVQTRVNPPRLGIRQGEETQLGVLFSYRLETVETEVPTFFKTQVTVTRDGQSQVIASRTAFRGARS